MSLSQDMPSDEREQAGHEQIIQDSWMRARRYIRQAEARVNPRRVLWPAGTPRDGAHEAALAAHSAVLQFRDDVRPFADDAEEIWAEQIATVDVDGFGSVPVSLANLNRWRDAEVSIDQTETTPLGERGRAETKRLLLPINVCHDIYDQLLVMIHEGDGTADMDFSGREIFLGDELLDEVEDFLNKPPSSRRIENHPIFAAFNAESSQRSQLLGEALTRYVTGRDINIVITAASETGVGKTTLAVFLALLLDVHGWSAERATVANPQKYDRLYDEAPPGSALILDEAEKASDARRSMSSEAVNLSQTFATKRYRQVTSILTAPSKSWIDKRLGIDAADYWIQAQDTDMGRIKGEARVYRVLSNEHEGQEYTKFVEQLHWQPLDHLDPFTNLEARKEEILETTGEKSYYDSDDVESIVSDRVQDAKREKEKELIAKIYESTEMSQQAIADALGISAGTVNRRLSS